MFNLVLEKAEEPEIKLPTSAGSSKKQKIPGKIAAMELKDAYFLEEKLWPT